MLVRTCLSEENWVRVASTTSFCVCILLAVGHSWTIGNVSIILYLASFSASLVGNCNQLVAVPWAATAFQDSSAISSIMAGGLATIVIAAGFAILQNPGPEARFGPEVMFTILALLNAASLCAFLLLLRRKEVLAISAPRNDAPTFAVCICCQADLFRNKKLLGLTAVLCVTEVSSWVVLRCSLPFAVNVVSRGGLRSGQPGKGQQLLAYAIDTSLLATLVGNTFSRMHCFSSLEVRPVLCISVVCLPLVPIFLLITSVGLSADTDAAPVILVTCAVVTRFLNGLFVPIIYARIGALFDNVREKVAGGQFCAAWAIVTVSVWVFIATLAIEVACRGEDGADVC